MYKIKAHRIDAVSWLLVDALGYEASAHTKGNKNLVAQLTREASRLWFRPEIEIAEPTTRGFCGSCSYCSGVDEETDTCICQIDDPHRDWRYKGNEPCPNWAI